MEIAALWLLKLCMYVFAKLNFGRAKRVDKEFLQTNSKILLIPKWFQKKINMKNTEIE